MNNPFYGEHYSVLNKEVVSFLTDPIIDGLGKNKIFADLTLGGAGHTLAILKKLPSARIIATDQDLQAIGNAKLILEKEGVLERCQLVHSNFSEISKWFAPTGRKLDGLVLDLGVSSHHFDSPERGFSFREDGPLDMRMNQNDEIPCAADYVNEMSETELADIIFQYGEDRFSRRIAKAIVEARQKQKILTTKMLEDIIFHSYPPQQRHGRVHPATRTFQAIRIVVNQELSVLEKIVSKIPELLASNGRACFISFHSLEDRIVKHGLKKLVEEGFGEVMSKKPILPDAKELEENSRSRSAKLRVFQRN